MNILVCEDNKMTLRTLEYSLKKEGFIVFKAEDGDQGIKVLNEEEISLVITDINMPYTKGLELVRYVSTEFNKRLPVIIISSITNQETKDHARELGAKGYLTKPFDLGVLIEMVNTLISEN